MKKLPKISSDKLVRILLRSGFEYAPIKGKGSHVALIRFDEINNKYLIIIPKRDPIPKGTLLSIINQTEWIEMSF